MATLAEIYGGDSYEDANYIYISKAGLAEKSLDFANSKPFDVSNFIGYIPAATNPSEATITAMRMAESLALTQAALDGDTTETIQVVVTYSRETLEVPFNDGAPFKMAYEFTSVHKQSVEIAALDPGQFD